MIKLFKYLKKSSGFIILIVILLLLQAYCDLSLPSYTSNIIDIGIQQGGIENAVPIQISNHTMENIALFLTEEQREFVSQYYIEADNLWILQDVEPEQKQELNTIFSNVMNVLYLIETDNPSMEQIKKQIGVEQHQNIIDFIKTLPSKQQSDVTKNILKQFENQPDTVVEQSAIAFLKQEYALQGIDLNALQTQYIIKSGTKMIAFALLIMLAGIGVTFFSCRVAATFGKDIREKVFSKVIDFSSAEFNKFSTASLITRSTNDVQQVQMLMIMIFRIVLYAPILGIGGIMMVLGTNTSMAWIIAVAVALILIVVGGLFAIAMPKFKSLQVLIDKLNLITREILTGIPVIRAFSTEHHEEQRFEQANKILTKTTLFANRTMTFMMPSMMLVMNGISVLIVYKGGYGIDAGAMQVGDLMAFIQYTMMIIMSFLMLTIISIMIPRASVSGTRINEVLETEITIQDATKVKSCLPEQAGIVCFENVSFCYPDAEERVISDISFTAEKGKTTAIIGSTGSGKSTLINLIPRFFDVTEGRITVDGVDVREISQKELREKIGYVPQKGVLFSGTIESNLRYGKQNATEQEIKKAAEIAQAIDFITEKEEGFDSPIAQGGTNVSGGQKQRLSIARAVIKNPEIYIFDDSFSALDYKTDVVLRKALKKETKDATTIIVAQRISTILHAEQIIVLDEGRIVGKGTHKELLKNCDVYKQIALSQLSEKELHDEKEEA
ncbi:ABC transporter ATP-binding protein [Lachnospiraceae bacterium 46-61]